MLSVLYSDLPPHHGAHLMNHNQALGCSSPVCAQAAANAKENQQASKAKLVVAEAFADQGPILKRFQPRSQGRANRILKPTFHLTIRLEEQTA